MRRFLPLLCVTLSILGGCRPSGSSSTASTLIYGRGEDAQTLDPIHTDVGESVKVIVNLYDTLIAYDDDTLDLVPSLATSWSHTDDGLTWTFQLRDDVRFHDGTALDADAVVFSFERMIQDEHPHVYDSARPYRPNFTVIEQVVAVGPREVQFKLREPSAIFENNLAMFCASIVSPAAVQQLGRDFGDHPVGTGPFRFTKWDRYERLVVSAYEDHWRGPPGVEHVVFVPVSERATRAEKLQRGEIHIADNLAPHEVDALARQPGLSVQQQPGMNVAYLSMQTEKPPLDQPKVRRAIWHAINKQDLVEVAYSGQASAAVNMLPPTMWGHHDGLQDRRHDPQLARRLLREAAAESGFDLPLPLTLNVMKDERPYMQQPLQTASFIKDSLAKIGIEVTVESKKANLHFEHLMAGRHELGLSGWSSDNNDPDNFLFSLLDANLLEVDDPQAISNNMSRYRDPEVHQLLLAAQRELNRDRRKALYEQVQALIFEAAPTVPLVHTRVRIVLRDSVTGYRLHPSALVRLRHARLVSSGSGGE